MAQSHDVLACLERLAGQMESVLAGQQRLEEAVRGLPASGAGHSCEAVPASLPAVKPQTLEEAVRELPTSGLGHSREAAPPNLQFVRQRSGRSEASRHQLPLHERAVSSEPAGGDGNVSESSSLTMSEFSVSHLKQRVLVPAGGFDASSVGPAERVVELGGDSGALDTPKMATPAGRSHRRSWLPLNPDSESRTAIDVVSCAVLLYDSIVIPFQMGWSLPLEGFFAGYVTTLAFWTLDFLLGFATSFYRRGDLVTDYKSIAMHYLKRDFACNFAVVLVDWVAIVIYLGSPEVLRSQTQFARALRMVKVQRTIHLVRVMKNGSIAKIYDRMTRVCFKHGLVEQFQSSTKILSILFLILWINHIGSCFWHWIGDSANSDYAASNLAGPERASDYLLSFYWSASAVVAGESIMSPTNSAELATTIAFILCGFILFSVLVSHLSASLLDLRLAAQERNASMFKLRQYFYQNGVRGETAMPIQAKVSERLSVVKRLTDKDVRVLELVPPAMRKTLRTEVYGPKLQSHFFIRTCSSLTGPYRSVLMDFCCTAMSNEVLAPGRVVFHDEGEAKGAYYLNWGECEYVLGGIGTQPSAASFCKMPWSVKPWPLSRVVKASSESSGHGETVEAGAWISDVALWVLWKHRGLLEVSRPSEMCLIGVKDFAKVIKMDPILVSFAQDYSNAMYAAILKESGSSVGDLSSGVDSESVITAMPLQSRVQMSMGALDALLAQQFLFSVVRGNRQLLYNEVQAGKCDLIVGADEEILRVVNVVALRVLRQDGRILAQVAEATEEGTVEPSVQLPGLKVKAGELPHDALQRLRSTTLSALSGGVTVGGREVNVQQKTSKAYRVNTRYMRNVYHAAWDPQFVHGDLPEVTQKACASLRSSSANVLRGMKSASRGIWSRRRESRAGKFKNWFSLKPFVVCSGRPNATRKILVWVLPEDFGAMLADEDHVREWLSCFSVPAGKKISR